MKISTKGRYGLRILADIALNGGEKPRLIREISKSQNLSQKYVGRLIIELRKKGFLNSIRGARGGYMLAKDPADITLLDILETMEGEMSVVACVACPKKCKRSSSCFARDTWAKLNNDIKASFSKITLADVMSPKGEEKSDFCI